MWIYVQKTGDIAHDDELIGCGYSGSGASKNCPADQAKHNLGPIPRGFYEIQAPHDTMEHGPFVLRLVANMENSMGGRGSFAIHGDSLQNPGTASQGCIVLGRLIRPFI